jgi:uncharacterized protein (TIGR03086 family)
MTTKTTTQPLPTDAAPFGPDDPRALFGRAVALGSAVIAEVRADQLDHPTACDGMDVRLLLGHLVMVLQRVAAAGRGEDPATWPAEATGLADDAWLPAWRAATHEVQAVWTDDALLATDIRLPWAVERGDRVLGIYTNEVTVHTWDLARATGQQPAWGDDVLEAALAAMRRALPADGRTESFDELIASLPPGVEWSAPFAAAVDVPDDAPLIDRLVAWNGRTP